MTKLPPLQFLTKSPACAGLFPFWKPSGVSGTLPFMRMQTRILVTAVIFLVGLGAMYWLVSRGDPHVEVRNAKYLDAAFAAARTRLTEEWSSAPTKDWQVREAGTEFGEFVMDIDCGCGPDACRVTVVASPYGMAEEAYAPAPSFIRLFTICP